MRTLRITKIFLAAGLFVLLAACTSLPDLLPTQPPLPTRFPSATPAFDPSACLPPNTAREWGTVTSVVDGDTIRVQLDGGGELPVRYIGVDTPETTFRRDPYGEEAKAANEDLVLDERVLLVRDVSETDPFERLLRYVFVGETFVNYELVAGGYAQAVTYPPDVSCEETFRAAQRAAVESQAGLWGLPTATPLIPTETVPAPGAGICPQGCATPPPGCAIKGNISADGEKIYHLPGANNYEQTVIDPADGERWFCTAAEAEASGWRPPN